MDPSICAVAVNGPRACPLWPLLSAGLMETLSQGPAKGLIMKQGSAYLWGWGEVKGFKSIQITTLVLTYC